MANAPGQPNQAQKRGSGFTNLSRIMQANQNNRLGSAIQSGITGGAQQVRQQLGDTRNQFNQASDANNLASDQNQQIRQNVLQNIAGGQSDISQQQADQFKQFRGGQYTGPTGLDSSKVAQLGSRASELTTQAKNPFSENTLQATVGAQSQQPYTRGQIGLDRTLLGTVKPDVLGQTRQAVRGLPQNVMRERDVAAGTGMLRQQQAAQFGADTRNQLAGQTGGITSGIDKQVADYAQQQAALYDPSLQGLKTGNVSQAPLGALRNLQGLQYYNLDPSQFLSKSGTPITKETVGTAQQKAQLDALAKLSGGANDYLTNVAQKAYDPNTGVTFDQAGFDKARAQSEAGYNQALQTTQAPLRRWKSSGGIGGFGEDQGSLQQAMSELPELQRQVDEAKAGKWYERYYKPQEDYISRIQGILGNVQGQTGYNNRFK